MERGTRSCRASDRRLDKDGDKEELSLDHPVVTEIGKDTLVVSAEDSKGHAFKITFYETRFEVAALSKEGISHGL